MVSVVNNQGLCAIRHKHAQTGVVKHELRQNCHECLAHAMLTFLISQLSLTWTITLQTQGMAQALMKLVYSSTAVHLHLKSQGLASAQSYDAFAACSIRMSLKMSHLKQLFRCVLQSVRSGGHERWEDTNGRKENSTLWVLQLQHENDVDRLS
jgi:hypothetical protein